MADYLAAAVEAARRAGDRIRDRLGAANDVQFKASSRDLVTAVDRAAQEDILNLLRGVFPDIPVLGEEGVTGAAGVPDAAAAAKLPRAWVVDPLDGTTNFVHGIPASTVSIALTAAGVPVVGVIYDPYHDELFTAVQGGATTCNGRAVRVRDCPVLEVALLATGYSPHDATREVNMRGLVALNRAGRNLRAFGSAALHLAWVSCGRLDGFYELGLNAWDLAAGALLVQCAGGTVTDTRGRPYALTTRHIVATCGPIHQDVLDLVAAADACGPDL